MKKSKGVKMEVLFWWAVVGVIVLGLGILIQKNDPHSEDQVEQEKVPSPAPLKPIPVYVERHELESRATEFEEVDQHFNDRLEKIATIYANESQEFKVKIETLQKQIKEIEVLQANVKNLRSKIDALENRPPPLPAKVDPIKIEIPKIEIGTGRLNVVHYQGKRKAAPKKPVEKK